MSHTRAPAVVRRVAIIAMTVALASNSARGQTTADDKAWSFSVSAYGYIVPEDRDYLQPTVTADRGRLHLEARYNYEGLDAGSAWLGYNFGGGEKLAWELTPILGGIVGGPTGIAPGFKGSLSWWKLELYAESEYLFDTGNSSDSFAYLWSELSGAPREWFRLGIAAQRTHVYKSERDVQRGLLVGASFKGVDVTGYVFNLDDAKPTFVLAAALKL